MNSFRLLTRAATIGVARFICMVPNMCFCGYENDVYILWSKKEMYPLCFCFNSDARKEKEKKRVIMKIYHC